jgi:hypothetical protein
MNIQVAGLLEEAARLLEQQHADPFRVQAYQNAATTIRELPRSVVTLLHEEGLQGLDALPNIGAALARAISLIVTSGRLPMLDRLRAEFDPVALLASIPGIGRHLAERIHDALDIGTLEELEEAAHDGRLAALPGFGPKRIQGIRDTLATRLRRPGARQTQPGADDRPTVDELLDVDREYRAAARAGRLHRIAPRRFNPERRAWLPVMHTWRDGRHYTALFSNTARAHALRRTRDWVVIYYDGPNGQQQHTIVTARSGSLAGQRIVRGRELECEVYHRAALHPRRWRRTAIRGPMASIRTGPND